MSASLLDRPFGIYEKALAGGAWRQILSDARRAGFDFVEMSIDESEERLARLEWSGRVRNELVRECQDQGIPIYSICLSAHRRFGLGSEHAATRARAAQILDLAIGLASDLGVRVIQIAGYYAFYEQHDSGARARYVDELRRGVALAAARGVMLAVENIDTADMASIGDCMAVRDEVASPWFQVYPDVGNLALHGRDVAAELGLIARTAVGLHLKDARPNEPRRVPFGAGLVPFADVFTAIVEGGYDGPFTIEMWNDEPATAAAQSAEALAWVRDQISIAAVGRPSRADDHLRHSEEAILG